MVAATASATVFPLSFFFICVRLGNPQFGLDYFVLVLPHSNQILVIFGAFEPTDCFQWFLEINDLSKDRLPQWLAIHQLGNSKEFGTVGFGDLALEVVDAGADQLFALVRFSFPLSLP